MDSLNLQLEGSGALNFNSVENLPGLNAKAVLPDSALDPKSKES